MGGSSGSVWDVATQQLRFKLGKLSDLAQLAFSPDGSLLACAHGKHLHLWSVADGVRLHKVAHGRGKVADLAFDPGGSGLLAATIDLDWSFPDNRMGVAGEIRCVDPATGQSAATTVPIDELLCLTTTDAGLLVRHIPQIAARRGLTRGGPGEAWDPSLGSHAPIQPPQDPPTMSPRALVPLRGDLAVSLELLGDDPATSPAADQRVLRVWDLRSRRVDQIALDPERFGRPMKLAASPEGLIALATDDAIHLARLA